MVSRHASRAASAAPVCCDAALHDCARTSPRRRPHRHDGCRCRSRGGRALRSPGVWASSREFSFDLDHSSRQRISAEFSVASCEVSRCERTSWPIPQSWVIWPDLDPGIPGFGVGLPEYFCSKNQRHLDLIVVLTRILGISPMASHTRGTLAALVPPVGTKDAQCSAADARKDTDGIQGSKQ